MFGSLFETEGEDTSNDTGTVSKLQSPSEPRGKTGICGLRNQGATCYLNSLLQTLFFTPEFRDGIFQLGAEDLGYGQSTDASPKVRVIPLQLQKVFAKLLLLDQDSINTTELTDSFGWTGNESFQQHDVQELNRILFNALESSFVGTAADGLIKKLYHGTSVSKVICKECGHASEREEDYLDLPLILPGCSGLEQSLLLSYVAMETLEGNNQYKCGSCGRHVDATKGSKIRTLPPVLTFSLLRFDYDLQRGERFKETKRYSFPTVLNMKQFCETNGELQNQDYELFSVVIHGGSCYGGHYHAYICDVQGLGTWSEPSENPVKIVEEDKDGKKDIVNCSHPVELISILLRKLGGTASVNQLCQRMLKEAGISWNKQFKSHYGPLTKFFKRNSDIFSFSDSCGWVSLKNAGENSSNSVPSATYTQEELDLAGNGCTSTSSQSGETVEERRLLLERQTIPDSGHCWFHLNDARISCINERDLQLQFAGKESAYMLFYRRKDLVLSGNDPVSSIPSFLRAEVEEMNKELAKQREDYNVRLNQISVSVYFGNDFMVTDGSLEIKEGMSTKPLIISLDRRQLVKEFLETITKLDSFRGTKECKTLHIARQLPAGFHLFEELTQNPEKSLLQSGVHDGTVVFLWNGREVDGCQVFPGEDTAPVLLNITYAISQDQQAVKIQKSFRKDATVGEMKLILCDSIQIELNYENLCLSWLQSIGKTDDAVLLNSDQDGDTLNELGLQDGDCLVARKRDEIHFCRFDDQTTTKLPSEEREQLLNTMTFIVENRCTVVKPQEEKESNISWPLFPVEILKEQTIGDLKIKVLQTQHSYQKSQEILCRFRVDHDFRGLSAPLYDHDTVSESWLQEGQRLVLEPGAPLLQDQIMIRYYVCSPNHTREEMEQIVDKNFTVLECLKLLMENTGLEGMTWHLRKTNWMGEPADSLDDEDATLGNENVKNGDILIVEEGRLPPKTVEDFDVKQMSSLSKRSKRCVMTFKGALSPGFIRLSLWETPSVGSVDFISWISSGVQGLLGSASVTNASENKGDNLEVTGCLLAIGDIEISYDATLYDLKLQISTLPQLGNHVIPTPGFLRLQEVVDGQQTRVLRGISRTLRQLKLTSSTQLSVRVLQQEEDLSACAVLLRLKRRIPGKRIYSAEEEVIYEPTGGATPLSLRQFVSSVCDIPLDRLNVAKYFRAKYHWLVIKNAPGNQGRKGGKKKVNLRQSPFHLQDGDIIGVKNCYLDPDQEKDDFSTPADDEGKERLKREEEEKRRRRTEKRTRRPEVPLTIHVDDFR